MAKGYAGAARGCGSGSERKRLQRGRKEAGRVCAGESALLSRPSCVSVVRRKRPQGRAGGPGEVESRRLTVELEGSPKCRARWSQPWPRAPIEPSRKFVLLAVARRSFEVGIFQHLCRVFMHISMRWLAPRANTAGHSCVPLRHEPPRLPVESLRPSSSTTTIFMPRAAAPDGIRRTSNRKWRRSIVPYPEASRNADGGGEHPKVGAFQAADCSLWEASGVKPGDKQWPTGRHPRPLS